MNEAERSQNNIGVLHLKTNYHPSEKILRHCPLRDNQNSVDLWIMVNDARALHAAPKDASATSFGPRYFVVQRVSAGKAEPEPEPEPYNPHNTVSTSHSLTQSPNLLDTALPRFCLNIYVTAHLALECQGLSHDSWTRASATLTSR
jgi:hypothetical protein